MTKTAGLLACFILACLQGAAQQPDAIINKLDFRRSVAGPTATVKYLEEIRATANNSYEVQLFTYPVRRLICRYQYSDLRRKIKQGLYLAWHSNGQLSDSGFYKQNRRHGFYYEWHPNGQLKAITHYQFDRPTDTTRQWNEDGSLLSEMVTDANGTGEKTDYYPSGEAWGQGPVRSGLPHGTWTFWRRSGHPLMTVQFEEGTATNSECYDAQGNAGLQPCEYLQPVQFAGGNEAWQAWVNKHLRYPRFGPGSYFTGIVKVQFVVLEDGSLTDIDILQSPGEMFDEEVRQLLAQSPKWQPALLAGRPISQPVVQDILFDNQLLIRR